MAGRAWRGAERLGKAGEARHGAARSGPARHSKNRMAVPGYKIRHILKTKMITRKLFKLRTLEINPWVIIRKDMITGSQFVEHELKGQYYRILPFGEKDIYAVSMMTHREDKWAPAKGNGIILSKEIITKFDQ